MAKAQESTAVSEQSKYVNIFEQPYRKDLGAPAARQNLDIVRVACQKILISECSMKWRGFG